MTEAKTQTVEQTTVGALSALVSGLNNTGLELDLSDATEARAVRDELASQVDDYIIPRLKRLDAPLLVVLGGSTGSGKSTITNSLVGQDVSQAGVLRPTTRDPVLICNQQDQDWFMGEEILPELVRVTATKGTPQTASHSLLRVVISNMISPGLAILDAPDIDSVEEANRDLAIQLLAAADMWLFTTTAIRYADAVPWEFLRQAQDRGTSLACIINRIPAGEAAQIVEHFATMLDKAGLANTTIFPIDQAELTEAKLDPEAIKEIHNLLTTLANDADKRAATIRKTLEGALASIPERVQTVMAAQQSQTEAIKRLNQIVDGSYDDANNRFSSDISSGTLLRAEVLQRWQELVGTAELMKAVQSRIGLLRDRITKFLKGQTGSTNEVAGEITTTLEQLLIDYSDQAASLTVTNWRELPAGRQVLDNEIELQRSSQDFATNARNEVRFWQQDILNLVKEQGATKRSTARILSLGVNSIGITLMMLSFAHTGGLIGSEIAIGTGTAALSQALLNAIFGEQAVRDLASQGRRMLLERVTELFNTEADRFKTKLTESTSPIGTATELKAALDNYLDAIEATR